MRAEIEKMMRPAPGKRRLRINAAFWLTAYSLDRDAVFVDKNSIRVPVKTRMLLECCLPADVLYYRYEIIQADGKTDREVMQEIRDKMVKLWQSNLTPMLQRWDDKILTGDVIEE